MVTGRKYFGTLLLHWKKSVLFTVLGGYGIKCVKEWNEFVFKYYFLAVVFFCGKNI